MRKSPLESTAQSQGKTQEVEQDPSVIMSLALSALFNMSILRCHVCFCTS